MKLEKKHWIIIGVIVAVIVIWYCFRKKKTESSFDQFGSPNDPFGDDTPKCPAGEVYSDSLPGCIPDEKKKESGYASKIAPPTTAQLKAAGVVNSRTAYRYLKQHYGNEQGITISFGGCGGQETPYGYVPCKKMFCIFGVCVCSCPSDAQDMLNNLINR